MGDGKVDIEEFVEGAMKLKGPARNVDVLSMMFDTARFTYKFNDLCSFLEDKIWDIESKLNPNLTKSPEKRFDPSTMISLSSQAKYSKISSNNSNYPQRASSGKKGGRNITSELFF